MTSLPLKDMWCEKVALLLVFLAVGILACKKDKDETAPRVRIIAPVAGTSINVPDTFTVRVEVSDDHIVEAVTIELLDADGITVASAGSISVNASSGTFARDIQLTDERLRSGSYTLAARASDGENDGRGFLGINVLEAPLRLRSIFLAPPFSTGPVSIMRIDSLGELSTWATSQDFNGIAVDSYGQHLIVAGSRFAPLQALPTAASANLWQVNAPANDQEEQFTAVTVDPKDSRVYFATRDGFIRGYTGAGIQQFIAQCLEGHRCEAIVVLDGEVATWQRAVVGGASQIVSYSVAGTVLHQFLLEHERVALFHRTGTSLVHFANEAGSGLIENMNVSVGGTPEVRNFPGETIRAVVRLDANTYVIALDDRLVRYTYSTDLVSQISAGISADALAYESATGALYVAEGSTLHSLDASTGMVINTVSTGSPIGHILPLLNR